MERESERWEQHRDDLKSLHEIGDTVCITKSLRRVVCYQPIFEKYIYSKGNFVIPRRCGPELMIVELEGISFDEPHWYN